MARWIEVPGAAESVVEGRGRRFQVDGFDIAIFRDRGILFALDDSCPHQGASLGEGIVHGGSVICPWHAWSFELASGQCPHVPDLGAGCYPVREREGKIEVEIPGDEAADLRRPT